MRKKWTTRIVLALLGLLLALPAAAETREGVIWLEGMEEPIEETRFESPEGFAFWYASDMLATESGAEGVVVSNTWSDDAMTLSIISEAEALALCADIARQPAERTQVEVYCNLEGSRFHFLSLVAENGHYLRAEGEYAMEAAEGIGKYFQRVLDTVEFAAGPAAVAEEAQSRIERAVVSYAADGIRDEQALSGLAALDPALGEKWTRIMDLWVAPVAVNDVLPDGLPDDDSLCLVALGFQLNPDGTMREELVERLNVLLAASRKYPNAIIACTGGGTATDDPTATEAERMAEWLEAQGVDAARLIVEDRSLTTAQNAIYTFDLLSSQHPQVKQIAIISSDYHIATGVLLFGAEAILRESDVQVVSNAAWHAPSGTLSAMFQAGALIELSGDVETAFEIYYDTYDIHELPPLHEAA